MSALANLSFDVTVDAIAYRPVDVDVLAKTLGDRGGHHIQISSVSAYDDRQGSATRNGHPLARHDLAPDAEVTAETYGPLRRPASERRRSTSVIDSLCATTFVIGSHDATLRFPTGRAPPPGAMSRFPDLVTTPPVHRRA